MTEPANDGTGFHRAPVAWEAMPARRLVAVNIALLVLFGIVVLRLVQIQVIRGHSYQELARRQQETTVPIPAMRGRIYDRNGVLLVSNSMSVSIGADPKLVKDHIPAIADRLARVFDKPRDYYLSRLTTPGKRFVWLERHASRDQARRLNTDEFHGLIELDEPERLYDHEHIGGQLIGFTDIDNRGLSGIELQEERYLKGTDGEQVLQLDAMGHARPSVDLPRIEAVNGNDVVLTLDVRFQAIAEEELRKGVERNKARSGLAVIMDPGTGELLAVANYPGFDPSRSNKNDQDLLRNRVITDMFEPGSVFKIVTASAALELHRARPDQKFNAENGTYVIVSAGGARRIINDTHKFSVLTFQEGIEQSSNIVMAKISNLVGAEGLFSMARRYGFGAETGIELPGEIRGELKLPSQWSGATLNSMAIGYEVGVTPIQLACAYAAVANRGWLMKPYVVRQVLGPDHAVLDERRPERIRQVVSKATCETLSQMFEGVVMRGTGVTARLPGLRIAGKTGTSRKFIDGKYEIGNYTATFVGYFPADNPRIVCLVMLDHPSAGAYTGGLASAPIFKAIAEKVYATAGEFAPAAEAVIASTETRAVPDVTGLRADAATDLLKAQGFAISVSGDGAVVASQKPAPGARLALGERVVLATDNTAADGGLTIVPDVRNLTARRAVNRLAVRQLDPLVSGSGIVRTQSPQAGERVRTGTRVVVRCEPRPVAEPVLY